MKLNKIRAKFIVNELMNKKTNKEEYEKIEALIKLIEKVFIEYKIFSEDKKLDFKINISKDIENHIERKYYDNSKITSLPSSISQDYQNIMKKVKSIPQI